MCAALGKQSGVPLLEALTLLFDRSRVKPWLAYCSYYESIQIAATGGDLTCVTTDSLAKFTITLGGGPMMDDGCNSPWRAGVVCCGLVHRTCCLSGVTSACPMVSMLYVQHTTLGLQPGIEFLNCRAQFRKMATAYACSAGPSYPRVPKLKNCPKDTS